MHIEQGEGDEQRDPLMSLSFALGQHASLCTTDDGFAERERLMAFLDDVYISTDPGGFQQAYGCVEWELWRHVRIRVHEGKTQVRNSGGERPEFCDVLERIAKIADRSSRVEWIWGAHDRSRRSGVGDIIGARRLLGNPVARTFR